MALMIGWENSPQLVLDEAGHGADTQHFFKGFYSVCVKFVVPIVMAFVLAGQMIDFFGGTKTIWYVVAFGALIVFWIFAAAGAKKPQEE